MSERLRRLRRLRGLSQLEVAAAVGVSRQAIAGIEAGAFEPSLGVALALARLFGVSVEALFGDADADTDRSVELVEPAELGTRLELVVVADHVVGVPRSGEAGLGVGFHPATARLVGAALARGREPERRALVVAGCDPGLALLAPPLARRARPLELVWWPAPSSVALAALERGLVHVAGFHVPLDEQGRWSLPGLPDWVEVRSFAGWREGLLTRDHSPRSAHALRRWRLANRQLGAEARTLLESWLRGEGVEPAELTGWDSQVGSHLMVAQAVAAGVADVGVALEPAAIEFGLRFTPLAREQFFLAMPRDVVSADEELRLAFEELLSEDELRRALSSLGGYVGLDDLGAIVRP